MSERTLGKVRPVTIVRASGQPGSGVPCSAASGYMEENPDGGSGFQGLLRCQAADRRMPSTKMQPFVSGEHNWISSDGGHSLLEMGRRKDLCMMGRMLKDAFCTAKLRAGQVLHCSEYRLLCSECCSTDLTLSVSFAFICTLFCHFSPSVLSPGIIISFVLLSCDLACATDAVSLLGWDPGWQEVWDKPLGCSIGLESWSRPEGNGPRERVTPFLLFHP